MGKGNSNTDRRAGILMPIASLPSKDGVGGFGDGAYGFIDRLSCMGVTIWQILPLNPLGYGNSPYQPYSSYAGDELYLDLEQLQLDGYLKEEPEPYKSAPQGHRIQYQNARDYKEKYLRKAADVFWNGDKTKPDDFEEFLEMEWVKNYAVFMAFKKKNGQKCWNEWPIEQQNWILDKKYDISELHDEIQYQIFVQYQFVTQWIKLKTYAHQKGVLIMGDVPFYVGVDSVDVWQARDDFLLDKDGRPSFVAGVPPDYFSETGQRWGNPIYNWDHMKQDDYRFWINRLAYSGKLYDIVRIDHFRAFDTFWKIPSSCPTAIEGEWVEAPGYDVLDRAFKALPDLWMVAEDLGDLRDEVLELRDAFNLAGMNIAEFSVLSGAARKHQLIYTGTHDNETVIEWYQNLDTKTQKKLRSKFKITGAAKKVISHKMVQYICKSEAELAIVSVVDLLRLGKEARFNTPGTVGSPNWEWRMSDFRLLDKNLKWMKQLIKKTKR